ncbi:MAG: tetratricopeptide repeat protein, partial [Vicingaceae bacterium]
MKKLLYIFIPSLILASCSGDPDIKIEKAPVVENEIDTQEERVAEIDKHTAILFSDSLNFNAKSANELLAAYEDYIKHHSFEETSLDYEFKAGELAKALNKPHVAIAHFNSLRERKPDHEKAGISLFYKAMIIGDMLHEDELAKETYQEFIDNYPDHPFVESAKASIALQGKSLDEIVKGFEEKNS